MDALWTTGSCDWSAIEDDDAAVAAGELRRGPWTTDEDAVLSRHVAAHGEGRWNELARAAGLRRTGKSCRLRWLNYLRPGVRRGDFAPREQLLILELHARWGNRWSRIAANLPGRTDNEVKNYWRTRVQKHARQLGCDVGGARFRDVVRNHWIPRLVERIHADEAVVSYHAAVAPSGEPSTLQQESFPNVSRIGNHPAVAEQQCASPDTSCVTTNGPSSSDQSTTSHGAHHQVRTNSPVTTTSAARAAAGCYWSSSSSEQCQRRSSTRTSSDDMFDGSWSELLARATTCHDDADSTSAAGLQHDEDFGFGETVDNFWSLDDISLQQLC